VGNVGSTLGKVWAKKGNDIFFFGVPDPQVDLGRHRLRLRTESGDTLLVLLCPAWNKQRTAWNLGDDADTTGAICGKLAGAYRGGVEHPGAVALRSGTEGHDRGGIGRHPLRMSGLVQKIAQVASNRSELFAIVTPLGNVSYIPVFFNFEPAQPLHRFGIRSDFRVPGLQIIGHDLHRPAVAPELVNNCADATEPLAQVGGIAPEASVGQVVLIKLNEGGRTSRWRCQCTWSPFLSTRDVKL
jgi:hypothetical protein